MMGGNESFELRAIPSHASAPHSANGERLADEDTGDVSPLLSPRRFSVGSMQSFELYTPDEDRAVRRRLDRRLVGFMALLYSLSFLDRSSEQLLLSSVRRMMPTLAA
jgi:hypothetical protein